VYRHPISPLNRLLAVVALIALAACGNASATSDTSPGTQPASIVEATATLPETTITTAPPTTVPPTTVPATTVPPTTIPSAAAATGDGNVLAVDVLAFIVVENEHRGGYVRDLFGYPADLDGDGCDTRAEVLQVESITAAQVDIFGCTVVQGDWVSVYDGLTFSNPGELEIDHVVALKEAWDSGAWRWNVAALVAYANDLSDPRGLSAVSTTTNRAKGDKDPSNWLPPDSAAVCRYVGDSVAVKARWGLSMDQSEYGRIRNLLGDPCAGWLIAPVEHVLASTAPVPFASPVPPSDAANTDAYYQNCTAARAAGVAPVHIGEPGYRPALDRDNDGIACE
jgi:excalibur calcium-binding domain-containing protein